MASSPPCFLYRNRYGIYCFQRRIPRHYRAADPRLPNFYRRSLATHTRSIAIRMARRLSAMFDELAQQYFATPKEFATALKLIQEFKDAEQLHPSFEEFQRHFLDGLDDLTANETELLSKAFGYVRAKSFASGNNSAVSAATETAIAKFSKLLEQRDARTPSLISVPLTKAFEEFITEKKQNWKGEDSESERDYRQEVFALLLEITGDIPTIALDKSHVNDFKKAVLHLPSNRRKKREFRELTIWQLIEQPVPEEHRLSLRTKAKMLQRLSVFLKWLTASGYAQDGLTTPLARVVKTSSVAHRERNQYNDADLTRLFNSNAYRNGLHEEPHQYWVPLIGLFTGARENEICQLLLDDIYRDITTGLWVFDFNEADSKTTKKSVKRAHHARQFPIHPRLVKLGFLKFVEAQRQRGESRLFPELPYRKRNKYADKMQRWFNRTYARKQCGITTPKTSFHSLRHTLVNHLQKQLDIQPHEFAHFIGQTAQGGEAATRYLKPELVNFERRYRRLSFDRCINFKAIRPWRASPRLRG